MTTAERVKAMTDSAKFETLAGAVIRQLYPEMKHMIIGGINASGETVKGPLDAFLKVADNRYVFIEYTMDDTDLEGKWLFDDSVPTRKGTPPKKPKGDLLKAVENFNTINSTYPEAELTVYLVTNQSVSAALWTKVELKAADLDVGVKQVELSVISNFLDGEPIGQYLREEFFGIEARMISWEIIQKIAVSDLSRYKADNFLDDVQVKREQAEAIRGQFFLKLVAVDFIVAESGMGKTSLCYDLMSTVGDDQLAFHIQPQFIESAPGILDALMSHLLQYNSVIHQSVDMLSKALENKQVLLIVDDVNRSANVPQLLSRLLSFVKEESRATKKEKEKEKYHIQIICPLWTRHFQNLQGKGQDKVVYGKHFIGHFSDAEALDYTRMKMVGVALSLSDLEQKNIAANLNNDPLLMALFFQGPTRDKYAIGIGINQAIEIFFNDQLSTLENKKGVPIAIQQRAITKLASAMLVERQFNPDLQFIEKHLSSTELGDALQIGAEKQLFSFDEKGFIYFRHDRVRDFILSNALSVIITESDPSHIEILSDPYYAELIGQAIALHEADVPKLEHFIKKLPVAVYTSLLFLDQESAYYQRVFQLLRNWNTNGNSGSITELERYEIARILLTHSLKGASDLCTVVKDQQDFSLIKFRSGDINGALGYFKVMFSMEPYIGYDVRKQIFDHVNHQHRQNIENQLANLLGSTALNELTVISGYLLVGYFKFENLLVKAYQIWVTVQARQLEYFSFMFWAALNSFTLKTTNILTDLIGKWDGLPKGLGFSGSNKPERDAVLANVGNHKWSFSEDQLDILISLTTPAEQQIVNQLLGEYDHPKAIGYIVGRLAHKRDLAGKRGAFQDDRWKFSKAKRRLSSSSQHFLVDRWRNKTHSDSERIIAFKYWNDNNPGASKLNLLKAIAIDDLLYPQAIYDRMHAGDQSISAEIRTLILNKPFLIWYLDQIWNEENKKFLLDYLNSVDVERIEKEEIGYLLRELLANISGEDARELLNATWNKFINHPVIFETALYIGDEEMLKKADQYLLTVSNKEAFFEHITSVFKLHEKTETISYKRFQALEPYLAFMKDNTRWFLAQGLRRSGMEDLAIKVVYPVLSDEKKKDFAPTNDDLVSELQDIAKDHNWHMTLDHNWIDKLPERGVSDDRLIEVLIEFCDVEHSLFGLLALGRCLEKRGKRADVPLLDLYEVKPRTILTEPEDIINEYRYSIKRTTLL
ncbi:hypothetical protein [Mucilaginibacter sp.]|uniref:hypothetical protein n=1 Tax=Mucilaginibacter sp. TaxID=1882438 RepID=UPI003D0977A7